MKPTKYITLLLAGLFLLSSLSSCDKLINGNLFGEVDLLGEYNEKTRDPQLQGWWHRSDNNTYLYFDCENGTIHNSAERPEPDSVPDASTKTHWYTLKDTVHIYYNSILNPDYEETITYAFIDGNEDAVYRKDPFTGNLTVWMTRIR